LQQVERGDDDKADGQQYRRGRRSSRVVEVLDQLVGVHRRHRRPAPTTRDQQYRAVLPHRSRERERGAGRDRGQQYRQQDAPEDSGRPRAEGGRCLFGLRVQSDEHRLHRSHDEWQRDEQQREEDGALRAEQVDANRAGRAVQRQ
jgi:hypothetical protein